MLGALLLLARVEKRDGENHDDQAERQPLGDLEADVALGMQELDQQLDADPADDDERAVDERRIALDERQQLADDQPHHDDAEDAAGQNDPELRRHRDGDENRVDGEHDVGQLDLHDGDPERADAHPRLRLRRRAPPLRRLAAREVLIDEEQQIPGADDLHPGELDQIDREQRREAAEQEGAEDAVSQGLFLLGLRQAEHQHGQHHRVVGAEQPFERTSSATVTRSAASIIVAQNTVC